jgi:hypothetical protein
MRNGVSEFALYVFDGFVQPVANAGVVIDRKNHVDTVVRRAEPRKCAMEDGHGAIPVALDHGGGSIDRVRQVSRLIITTSQQARPAHRRHQLKHH